MNNNENLKWKIELRKALDSLDSDKDKIEAMKGLDLLHSDVVLLDRLCNAALFEEMTTRDIYDITKDLDNLAQLMDLGIPLFVCDFLNVTRSRVFYTMGANSGAFAQYIAEKPAIKFLKILRDRLITITKWWERYGDEIYIKCINEPENKTLPSAIDRVELEKDYKVAREWLKIIESANIPEPGKPEGIKSMTHTLPAELDNERTRRYFSRAVEAGLMSEQYKWLASHAKLGYFCCKSFEQPRPITALEQFFGLKNLAASITQASYEPKRGDVKKWRAELDRKIFFD